MPDQTQQLSRAPANRCEGLAEATDLQVDPDRRAWHFAQAPDEDIASALECSASRAQARGGPAAAAFLERAAVLTPEASRCARRALAAAQTMFESGALEDALALLDGAQLGGVLDEDVPARVQLLRAQIAFVSKRGNDANQLLLAAAQEIERIEPSLARATYLEALPAAVDPNAGLESLRRPAVLAPVRHLAVRPFDRLGET